jgi:hypothetical protein
MKKIYAAIIPLFFMASFGHAQSISEALNKCGQTQNSLKRLVCYDGIVNDMDKYSGLDDLMNIPAPLSQTRTQSIAPVSAADAPQVSSKDPVTSVGADQKKDDFGLEHKRLYEETEDKVYVTISSVERDQLGKRTFTLDNGHVWEQITAERFSVKSNQVVFIERGVLNSYMMGSDSFNKKTRIKRIK